MVLWQSLTQQSTPPTQPRNSTKKQKAKISRSRLSVKSEKGQITENAERIHPGWELINTKSGKTFLMRDLKVAMFSSGHGHRLTENSLKVGNIGMPQVRTQITVETIKRQNVGGVRPVIDVMMQNPPADWDSSIYGMMNGSSKVLLPIFSFIVAVSKAVSLAD